MRTLVIVSLAFLVLACQDATPVQPELGVAPEMAVAQAPGGANDVVKMVPFKMKGIFWIPAEGDPSPCAPYADAIPRFLGWEGTGTHLGRLSGTGTNCVRIGADGSRVLLSQAGTITAANGDLLFLHGTAAEDGIQLIIHPDGSFEIYPVPFVGGTGRFENAEGWYHLSGENALGGSFTMEGMISSVGSSK